MDPSLVSVHLWAINATEIEIPRGYNIQSVTLSNWKKKPRQDGAKGFGASDELSENKDTIARLERTGGKGKVEIARLKSFWVKADHD